MQNRWDFLHFVALFVLFVAQKRSKYKCFQRCVDSGIFVVYFLNSVEQNINFSLHFAWKL